MNSSLNDEETLHRELMQSAQGWSRQGREGSSGLTRHFYIMFDALQREAASEVCQRWYRVSPQISAWMSGHVSSWPGSKHNRVQDTWRKGYTAGCRAMGRLAGTLTMRDQLHSALSPSQPLLPPPRLQLQVVWSGVFLELFSIAGGGVCLS